MREPERILVQGGSEAMLASVADALRAAGFEVFFPADEGRPRPALVVLGDATGASCAELRQDERYYHLPILAVLSGEPPATAEDVITAGADDAIGAPPSPRLLARKVHELLGAVRARAGAREARRASEVLLDLQRLAARGGDPVSLIHDVLVRAAPILGEQASLLVLSGAAVDEQPVLFVPRGIALDRQGADLTGRPELQVAMESHDTVVLRGDAPAPPPSLTRRVAELAASGLTRVVVFPLLWQGKAVGAFCVETSQPAGDLESHAAFFGASLATTLALLIGTGRLSHMRDQTQPLPVIRFEAARRLRAIEQFQAYFEAASDGVVVLDGDGRVLFVNRAAEVLTGFARQSLLGRPLADLVPSDQRDGLEEVVARVLRGNILDAFDLDMMTTSGDRMCVSVATSTVLGEHGAAILSFRDVTSERHLEGELRKTKEFLEKLIDSTVDAIVAADVDGRVILFNPGAERIFGWRAEEVIGRQRVERLYPDGVATQIMHMLRSPAYGGVGRLELTRREIVTKKGELVPVNMTASIIYEGGREVATVGILSDLRERIHIEQRLLQAQEKLLLTEKQAVIAELAGAAAHELNQPLTSVMLYAELMQKKLSPEAQHWRAVNTIMRETERMAEIVKKIGRITKYETKAYVGSASILDLEKSSDGSDVP